jgi:ketosteroid isomerase-like protein
VTAESPAQTVQRLFPLLAEGKTTEAAALFADSVSFSIPHPPGIPWVPEADSAEGMRTFFELLRAHVQPKEFDLRQVVAEGDDVVLIGRMVSEVKKTGRDIDTAFALHTTVRDGRITRYHLYEDTYAVAKAYFDD